MEILDSISTYIQNYTDCYQVQVLNNLPLAGAVTAGVAAIIFATLAALTLTSSILTVGIATGAGALVGYIADAYIFEEFYIGDQLTDTFAKFCAEQNISSIGLQYCTENRIVMGAHFLDKTEPMLHFLLQFEADRTAPPKKRIRVISPPGTTLDESTLNRIEALSINWKAWPIGLSTEKLSSLLAPEEA